MLALVFFNFCYSTDILTYATACLAINCIISSYENNFKTGIYFTVMGVLLATHCKTKCFGDKNVYAMLIIKQKCHSKSKKQAK